jgi:hypothetical protein
LSTHEQQERIPIQLLKEGAAETKGKDARKNSFAAVKLPSNPYGDMPSLADYLRDFNLAD